MFLVAGQLSPIRQCSKEQLDRQLFNALAKFYFFDSQMAIP